MKYFIGVTFLKQTRSLQIFGYLFDLDCIYVAALILITEKPKTHPVGPFKNLDLIQKTNKTQCLNSGFFNPTGKFSLCLYQNK